MSGITTSQTIGPFPHEAWRWAFAPEGTRPAEGSVLVGGRVLDGDGNPVDDAILEARLPGASAGPVEGMPGFWRVPTAPDGSFRFAVPRGEPGQPALWVTVFGRGIVKHQFSAVFLGDDPRLGDSPLLGQVPDARRATLVAERAEDGSYRWDVRLQGDRETVFFDFE